MAQQTAQVASPALKTFELGQTYWTRSVCDHDCIIRVTVEARTEKTIRTPKGKTLRIRIVDGVESVKPWGSYSMAPVVTAERRS